MATTDVSALCQAGAAIVALGISVWAVLRQDAGERRAAEAEQRKQNVRAQSLAVAIYPDLLKLDVLVRRSADRVYNEFPKETQQFNTGFIGYLQHTAIDIPPMLDRNVDHLHFLGIPAGATTIQLVSVIWQFNEAVARLANAAAGSGRAPQAVYDDQLGSHLKLLRNILDKALPEVQRVHDAASGD